MISDSLCHLIFTLFMLLALVILIYCRNKIKKG